MAKKATRETPPDESGRWLLVRDAARHARSSPSSVYVWIHLGLLRCSQINGGPFLIDKQDLDRLLEKSKRRVAPYKTGSKPWVRQRWERQREAKARAEARDDSRT